MHYFFTILDRLAALPPTDSEPFGDVGGILILRGQTNSEFMRAALREEFLREFGEVDEEGKWFLAEGAPTEWLQAVVLPEHDTYGAYVLAEELSWRAQKTL